MATSTPSAAERKLRNERFNLVDALGRQVHANGWPNVDDAQLERAVSVEQKLGGTPGTLADQVNRVAGGLHGHDLFNRGLPIGSSGYTVGEHKCARCPNALLPGRAYVEILIGFNPAWVHVGCVEMGDQLA